MVSDLVMFLFFLGIAIITWQVAIWWYKRWGLREVHFHGLHRHACQCGRQWMHDDRWFPVGYYNETDELEHICPECGTVVNEISEFIEGDSYNPERLELLRSLRDSSR